MREGGEKDPRLGPRGNLKVLEVVGVEKKAKNAENGGAGKNASVRSSQKSEKGKKRRKRGTFRRGPKGFEGDSRPTPRGKRTTTMIGKWGRGTKFPAKHARTKKGLFR